MARKMRNEVAVVRASAVIIDAFQHETDKELLRNTCQSEVRQLRGKHSIKEQELMHKGLWEKVQQALTLT